MDIDAPAPPPDPGLPSWQQVEHAARERLEAHGFHVQFRRVFRGQHRKFEVDVVARRGGVVLAVDCKRYGPGRARAGALRRQCATHAARCAALARLDGAPVYPVLVSLLDDRLLFERGCLVVPLAALDDFLAHLEAYLEQLPWPVSAEP